MINPPQLIQEYHVYPGSDIKEVIEDLMTLSKRTGNIIKFTHNTVEIKIFPNWPNFKVWVLLYLNQWRRELKQEPLNNLSEHGTKEPD